MGRTSGSSGLDDAGRTVNSGLLDGQFPALSILSLNGSLCHVTDS
jgi:hypothetical protein